jgi:hypothetical protein
LAIAAETGFRWFASDEGILSRTLGIGFGRDAAGVPSNAERLYLPLRVRFGDREIIGIFRDHYLSDLIGFVYSRMDAVAAAEDLHRRIRVIGERVPLDRPLLVAIILDGENAWEYYPGGGREFLRQFYRRIEGDPDIAALTVSEALALAREIPAVDKVFPGSWINANFDIWIGHSEDVAAWSLLREARAFYATARKRHAYGLAGAPVEQQFEAAYESLLAAEGSDWCWWYGPEHSSENDAEFDALYRKHLTEVYVALGAEAPDELAEPIKLRPERALVVPPSAYLRVRVDGRESSYFEWLGAGLYSAQRRSGALHGRAALLHELHYGFDENFLYVRVDPFPKALAELRDCEFRVTLRAAEELRVIVDVKEAHVVGYSVEAENFCLLSPQGKVAVALDRVLEVAVARELCDFTSRNTIALGVALWQGGLPVDVLPAEGWLDVRLGAEAFAWPAGDGQVG